MNPFLLLLLAGLGVYAFSRTGNILLKLKIYPENGRIHNISLYETQIKIDLNLENTSNKNTVIQAYDMQVIYSGQQIGTIYKAGLKISLPARKKVLVKNIPIKISNFSLLEKVIDIFKNGNYSTQVTIKGTVTADGIKFPFEKVINLINE